MSSHGDAGLYMPLGPAMKNDFPDVIKYVRYQKSWDEKFVKADDKILQISIAFTDPQFFSLFSFRLLFGQPSTALIDQHNVVIRKDKAIQFFGTSNAIGKTLQLKVEDKFEPYTVIAVVENIA